MALINCPECNAQISDAATACPRCGAPLTKPFTNNTQPNTNTAQPSSNNTQPSGNNIPACPENHLTKAIILTILCCWPLGIPAIVNAAAVNNAYIAGRYDVALHKSQEAAKWCKYCLIAGVVFWGLYIIFIAIYAIAVAGLL